MLQVNLNYICAQSLATHNSKLAQEMANWNLQYLQSSTTFSTFFVQTETERFKSIIATVNRDAHPIPMKNLKKIRVMGHNQYNRFMLYWKKFEKEEQNLKDMKDRYDSISSKYSNMIFHLEQFHSHEKKSIVRMGQNEEAAFEATALQINQLTKVLVQTSAVTDSLVIDLGNRIIKQALEDTRADLQDALNAKARLYITMIMIGALQLF